MVCCARCNTDSISVYDIVYNIHVCNIYNIYIHAYVDIVRACLRVLCVSFPLHTQICSSNPPLQLTFCLAFYRCFHFSFSCSFLQLFQKNDQGKKFIYTYMY